MCAVQIETREALAAVDEIAAVDGVDVVFVGPVDLANALGIEGPPDSPELLAAASSVAAAAEAHGKTAGVLVGNLTQLEAYRDAGFRFLGCNSDGGLLVSAVSRLAADLDGL